MPATLLSTGIHNVDNSYFTYASNDKKKKRKKKKEKEKEIEHCHPVILATGKMVFLRFQIDKMCLYHDRNYSRNVMAFANMIFGIRNICTI